MSSGYPCFREVDLGSGGLGGEQYGEYRVGAHTERAGRSLKVGGHQFAAIYSKRVGGVETIDVSSILGMSVFGAVEPSEVQELARGAS